MDIVIDHNFKEFFAIPNASVEYKELLETLPMIYQGPRKQLKQVLYYMSIALKSEYDTKYLPPWRSYEGLLESYNISK